MHACMYSYVHAQLLHALNKINFIKQPCTPIFIHGQNRDENISYTIALH